jgi:adenosylcobalamin-dependent ribonucleoside-triphosphate reductase
MDMSRKYGRLIDPPNNKDWRVAGYNPCAEQSLESYECCTLVETYLNRHESLEDYKRTLKFAYLYAKTVTLLPTHWEKTNAIMQRNRRIGASMSGIANFADIHGIPVLREWMDQGYEVVKRYDNVYSEWFGIRESIKMTTVKPSGTVSILAGESPGVHWTPGGKYFLRAIRFGNDDPMLPLFKMANYRVEPASESPDTTSVVFFPIKSGAKRAEKDVTIFEKMAIASVAQRYWSDNSVSVTISFDSETEKEYVGTVLHMYDGQLKTVSFLPSGNFTYPQMPYTQITEEEYSKETLDLFPIDFAGVYAGMAADAVGEAYCTTDSCEIKLIKDNISQ